MSQLVFDQDIARQLEALYRIRDTIRRRRLVREALGAVPGERIVDVGCGPGFFCVELAEEVGESGIVLGLDTSAAMLALAKRRCAGRANVELREAEATHLPVEDGSFDAALCVQVLEYVPDATAALADMRRVLRPGGRVVVWDVDWRTVSWHSGDPARMRRVLEAWDAHLTHPFLPRTLAPRMRDAGFEEIRAEGHTFATIEGDLESYGGVNVSLIESYVASNEDIGPDEAAAWAGEQRELAERAEFYFACVQLCFTARRPEQRANG